MGEAPWVGNGRERRGALNLPLRHGETVSNLDSFVQNILIVLFMRQLLHGGLHRQKRSMDALFDAVRIRSRKDAESIFRAEGQQMLYHEGQRRMKPR
jgi:hypothetical protein